MGCRENLKSGAIGLACSFCFLLLRESNIRQRFGAVMVHQIVATKTKAN
jgi:hypothetical protein